MSPIGRKHAALRRLRELVRDAARRREEGAFVAEGVHLAEEALASGATIEAAYLAPRLDALPGGAELRARLSRAAASVWETAEEALDAAQDARSPQPVALVVRARPTGIERTIDGRAGTPLLLVAWGLQDPGNLGSLLRSADAAGATGAFVCGEGADLRHPRTVRASAGSIFRLPVAEAPFDEILAALRTRRIPSRAAVPRAADYARCAWSGPAALVLGREGLGLPPEIARDCDATIGIPMADGVDSLSVAAAGAIVLFEAARQRRLTTSG